MSGKGAMAWLIPLAALAVPGFLFYNWWSGLNAQSRAELQRKIKNNQGLKVFLSGKSEVTNPLSAAPREAAAPSSAVSSAAAVSPAPEGAAATASSETSPAPVVPSAEVAVASAAAAGPAAALGEPAKAAPVALSRDPTLSPYDLVLLARIELEKQKRTDEVIDAARPKKRKAPLEPPIEDSMEVQGVVGIGSEIKAIINNEIVGVGDVILGKVKIVGITPDAVFCSYKNRKFSKAVSK